MMQRRWLPGNHLEPRLARVRNIGKRGITMNEQLFYQHGYHTNPSSTRTERVTADMLMLGDRLLGDYPFDRELYVRP